jgi:hypothetical protein
MQLDPHRWPKGPYSPNLWGTLQPGEATANFPATALCPHGEPPKRGAPRQVGPVPSRSALSLVPRGDWVTSLLSHFISPIP